MYEVTTCGRTPEWLGSFTAPAYLKRPFYRDNSTVILFFLSSLLPAMSSPWSPPQANEFDANMADSYSLRSRQSYSRRSPHLAESHAMLPTSPPASQLHPHPSRPGDFLPWFVSSSPSPFPFSVMSISSSGTTRNASLFITLDAYTATVNA
jgi:hypothetical protein